MGEHLSAPALAECVALAERVAAHRVGRLRLARYNVLEYSKANLHRVAKQHQLSAVRISPGLQQARHVLIATIHNEAHRIGYFLDYYRALGIGQFIVIDNGSTDGLRDLLENESGVSVFSASGSYRDARFGNDWINRVLSKYCVDKWILYVDADEFLVYPHCDRKNIVALTEHLARTGRSSMNTLMVDMYSDRPIDDNRCPPGCDPAAVCSLYDRNGYQTRFDPLSKTTWIKGGVRGRLFFDDVWKGPALNKTPLVYWQRHFAFLKSSHELWPPRLNRPAQGMSGALLHFKFLADMKDKLGAETVRQQHTVEYAAYTEALGQPGSGNRSFVGAPTARYEGWPSLANDGLISADVAFL
ncbi:MAG TPA: glycosyltransferase family 2 protein [Paraburkholderia sp.]|jgi:hypothetical protein|nr:glycosyltransferase family 2 protein [Paraburkholderia sp.]